MNNNTDLLRGFFGAYFHQDWELDAANTQEVVAQYVEVSTPEERRVLSQAILEYCNRFTDDRELEEALYRELYCEYPPSADGLTAKGWLESVAAQFLKSTES